MLPLACEALENRVHEARIGFPVAGGHFRRGQRAGFHAEATRHADDRGSFAPVVSGAGDRRTRRLPEPAPSPSAEERGRLLLFLPVLPPTGEESRPEPLLTIGGRLQSAPARWIVGRARNQADESFVVLAGFPREFEAQPLVAACDLHEGDIEVLPHLVPVLLQRLRIGEAPSGSRRRTVEVEDAPHAVQEGGPPGAFRASPGRGDERVSTAHGFRSGRMSRRRSRAGQMLGRFTPDAASPWRNAPPDRRGGRGRRNRSGGGTCRGGWGFRPGGGLRPDRPPSRVLAGSR